MVLVISFFKLFFCVVTILASSIDATEVEVDDKDFEFMLINRLTKNYRKGARPVHSNREPVRIYFDVKVNKLEKLVWYDPHLKWNKTQFNGTNIITLDGSSIWTPDIMLYNTAEDVNKSPSDIYKAPVNVYPDGKVIWHVPVVWKSTCAVDITWFPVDTQTCKLIFASLSYTKSRLKLLFYNEPKHFHDSTGHHHVTNGEWDYKGMKVFRKENHYECCHESMEQIVYELTIKRKPLFFLLYMIFPVCAVVLLSLLGFIIPTDSGERVGFGVTILLTMGVYLMVISEDLPKTAHSAPLIGVLYVTLFYVMILGYVASTINVNIALWESKPPRFLLRLARKQKLPMRQRSFSMKQKFKRSTLNEDCQRTSRGDSVIQSKSKDGIVKEYDDIAEYICDDWPTIKDTKITRQCQKSTKKNTGQFSPRCHQSPGVLEADRNNEDWRRIAAYLDKMFFILFLILIIISSATVLVALKIMYS